MPSVRSATISLLLGCLLISAARGSNIRGRSPVKTSISDVRPDIKLVKLEFRHAQLQLLFTSSPTWISDIGERIWLGRRSHAALTNSARGPYVAVGIFHGGNFVGIVDFHNDTLHVQPAGRCFRKSTQSGCVGYLSSELVTQPPNSDSKGGLTHGGHLRLLQLIRGKVTRALYLELEKLLSEWNDQRLTMPSTMNVTVTKWPDPRNLHLSKQKTSPTTIANLMLATLRPARAAPEQGAPEECAPEPIITYKEPILIRDHVLPCQICPYSRSTTTEHPTIYPSLPEIEATLRPSTFRPPFPLPNMLGPPLPYPLKPQFVERLSFNPDLVSPVPGEYVLPPTTPPGCQCDMCMCPTSPKIIVKVRPCCCPVEDENPTLNCCCPRLAPPDNTTELANTSESGDRISRCPSGFQHMIHARHSTAVPPYIPPTAAIKLAQGPCHCQHRVARLATLEAPGGGVTTKKHVHPRNSVCENVCRPCVDHCLCDRPDMQAQMFPQLKRPPKVLPFPLQQQYALSSKNFQTYTTECFTDFTDPTTMAIESLLESAQELRNLLTFKPDLISLPKPGIKSGRAELDSSSPNLVSTENVSANNKPIEAADLGMKKSTPIGQLILDSINSQIKSAYPHLFTRVSAGYIPNYFTVDKKRDKILPIFTNTKTGSAHSPELPASYEVNNSIPTVVPPLLTNNMFLLRVNPQVVAKLVSANWHQQIILPSSQPPNTNMQRSPANTGTNIMAFNPNFIHEIPNTSLKDPITSSSTPNVIQAQNANMMRMPSPIQQLPNINLKAPDANVSMSSNNFNQNNTNLQVTPQIIILVPYTNTKLVPDWSSTPSVASLQTSTTNNPPQSSVNSASQQIGNLPTSTTIGDNRPVTTGTGGNFPISTGGLPVPPDVVSSTPTQIVSTSSTQNVPLSIPSSTVNSWSIFST